MIASLVLCPVCGFRALMPVAEKSGTPYWSCAACQAIFSKTIDPTLIATHNDGPQERANPAAQRMRIERACAYVKREPRKLLDFGCGRGDFLDYLKQYDIETVGVDQHTKLQLPDVPRNTIDIVNMVEVIEHLYQPLKILARLRAILRPGGVIYIESSFADFIGDPAQSSYVDPRIGHCCIHSRRSIDYLSRKLGMEAFWINNNVVIFRKLPHPLAEGLRRAWTRFRAQPRDLSRVKTDFMLKLR